MDPENNNTPTPEEIQMDQEALAEAKEDEIRSSFASELGLSEDNEDHKGYLDKLVAREKESRKKLSGAISQKIKWRDKANAPKPQTQQEAGKPDADEGKQTEAQIAARFDEEFLEDSDYSDDLKSEIRKIAKLNGVSARKATKDSYIVHLIEKEAAEAKAQEAANNGAGSGRGGKDGGDSMPSKFTDPKFMITADGQKEYNEWLTSQA